MTIGQQFLARLNEAKGDKKPKFELDRGTEAMKRAMRKIAKDDLADKIAEVMNMAGIPGMYLNKPEVRERVVQAAQDLRPQANRVRAFLAMHSAMAAFRGMMPVQEAKEEDLEGSAFQQLLEEVLITLGTPPEMMTAEAKSVIKSGIRKMAAALRADQSAKSAIITFARLSNIRVNDKVVGRKKPGMQAKVEEATQPQGPKSRADVDSNDTMNIQMAKQIIAALGVLENETSSRAVRIDATWERDLAARTRNSNLRTAMAAFIRAYKPTK